MKASDLRNKQLHDLNNELVLLLIASNQPGNHKLWLAVNAGLADDDNNKSNP